MIYCPEFSLTTLTNIEFLKIPAFFVTSKFQSLSLSILGDEGLSWGPVKNISLFLNEHRGLLPGPGTGAYLPEADRMIFAGHYSTAEREDGRVVMYYRYSKTLT